MKQALLNANNERAFFLVLLHHITPQVDASFTGMTVDLLEFFVRECQVVERIERVIKLRDRARSDESGGYTPIP